MPNLTLSGNEITDDVRIAAIQGDGLAPETTTGIWQPATNLDTNGGFEDGTAGSWAAATTAPANSTARAVFGTHSLGWSPVGADTLSKTVSGITAANTLVRTVWIFRTETAATITVAVRNNANSADLASTVVPAVLGWNRVQVRATLEAAQTATVTQIRTSAATAINIDGAQLEQSTIVATPYVHTNGATATRPGGSIALPPGMLIGAQGWAAFRIRMQVVSTDVSPYGAASWQRVFFIGTNGNAPGNVSELVWADDSDKWQWSNGNVTIASIADVFTIGDTRTLICTWNGTALKLSLNGAAFVSATAESASNIIDTNGSIGCRYDGGGTYLRWLDGEYFWALIGRGSLTDADAATIHAYGNTDPDPNFDTFPGNLMFYWDGETSYFSDHTRAIASPYHSGSFGPF